MSDDTALRRQWLLLKALSSRRNGLTVREMAGEAEVSDKTIRRDIDLFRSVGFPIDEESGDFGRKTWRMKRELSGPPLAFSTDEAAALFLCRRFLEPLSGTLLWEAVQNALDKVRATLSPLALKYLSNFERVVFSTAVGSHDYSTRRETIDFLQLAIEDRKCVWLLYRSERSPEATRREAHPYGLIQHRSALYLVALDPSVERVKHYKVDRIECAEESPTPFRMLPGFALKDHLAPAFGVYVSHGEEMLVTVRFSPDVARFVRESKWHDSQTLILQPDGGLVAEFRLTAIEEVKHWVMSFGPKAEVLRPVNLRREIIAELDANTGRLSEPPSGVTTLSTIDLTFKLTGSAIPLDHGYALFSALCRVVPDLHGSRRVGVHPIRGIRNEPRRLTLVPQSKLRLRMPSEEIGQYLEIAGRSLDLEGTRLTVGFPRVESLRTAPDLFSRLVTVGHLVEPGPFEESIRRQLRSLGVSAEPSSCPRQILPVRADRPAVSSASRAVGSSATPYGSSA